MNTESSHSTMLRLLTGCWVSRAITTVVQLGIADLLADAPQNAESLAALTQSDPSALYRLLRALASEGIFCEDDMHRFSLTPLAATLQRESAGSLQAFAAMIGSVEHWRSWEGALDSVKTGAPAFEAKFGMPLFQYLQTHAEAARLFDAAMTSRSASEIDEIIARYRMPSESVVVDIGGGQGALLTRVLAANPGSIGILFDLPRVIRSLGEDSTARIRCIEGDFFAAVPVGDIYILKRVLHDWDDVRAIQILSNVRRSMRPSSRLLVIEPIIAPGNDPAFGKWLDLLMLLWHEGGRERSEAEHQRLLSMAGLRIERRIPLNANADILESVPAHP